MPPPTKREIAQILEDIGLLLELKGESPFKSQAYYNAARTIEGTVVIRRSSMILGLVRAT